MERLRIAELVGLPKMAHYEASSIADLLEGKWTVKQETSDEFLARIKDQPMRRRPLFHYLGWDEKRKIKAHNVTHGESIVFPAEYSAFVGLSKVWHNPSDDPNPNSILLQDSTGICEVELPLFHTKVLNKVSGRYVATRHWKEEPWQSRVHISCEYNELTGEDIFELFDVDVFHELEAEGEEQSPIALPNMGIQRI